MPVILAARWLLTLVGIYTAVGCWIFDYGASHMFNERWPPHAKFHNAQTLLFGSAVGILSIYWTWRRRGSAVENLGVAGVFGSLYWATQAGSLLLPNTALVDPEFAAGSPKPFGMGGPQPLIDVVALVLVAAAYALVRLGEKREANRIA